MTAPIDRFDLRHPRGVTSVAAGDGALAAGLEPLGERLAEKLVFAVTSRPIAELHGAGLDALARRCGELRRLEVPDGEAAKSPAVAERLWRELGRGGALRDSAVVAFGGGSVGDLAGFVAGTYARGLDLVQLPTTLLAQVDAALGGKCALDLPEGKNLVGLFHHPVAVVADTRLLATLPPAQLRSGLVEAVKMAALLDLELFGAIETDLGALLAGDAGALAPVVARALRAKARVVESDPEERSGARALLNFGHTLGHALEAEAGYGALLHGDAVAHGLRFALRLSVARGGDRDFAARLERLLDRMGVPPLPRLDAAALLARVARDKKARRGGTAWVLARGPGAGCVDREVPPELVERELARFLEAAAS
jgi:3-dehydroquinate synthase